jgi:uncharacterized protein (TIGR03663 family)
MNPQPPVTRMRTAPDSSAGQAALADFPSLPQQIQAALNRLAQVDWQPWLIVALAAALRLFLLGIKPPHFDEGINGWFVDQMTKSGFYRYDPTNYHGPLHFYVLFLAQTLFGRNVWALRMPVVLISIASVWLTLKFQPFVGRNVARLAALAMAISPGFVFYGRYSIHEVWLVFFSMLFVLGLIGLWKAGTPGYLWCAGMGLTGMILTKETYIIHVTCAVIAAGVCYISHRLNPVPDVRPALQTWDMIDLAFVVGTGLATIVFFYSGTFLHWSGVKGLYQAYAAWFSTGTEGHGHEKPWYYWLKLIWRYEIPVLGGLIVCAFCQFFRNITLRYLAIYGVGTLIAYSVVHYKTPWCIISIIWPFLFIFAAGVFLAPLTYKRAAYVIAGAMLLWSFGWTIWLNYFRCTTDTEPYVYVQTYNDVFKLSRPVLALAERNPSYYQMVGHIIRTSSYPLPWVLGDFPHVGYYEHEAMPNPVDADFLLVQPERVKEIEEKLQKSYFTEPLTIRPYQETSKVYFEAQRFKDFFPGRSPDFKGKGPG